MRNFKFRVWENVEGEMNYDCIVCDNFIIFNYTGGCEDDLFTENVDFVHLCKLNRKCFTIMQYTGIRDMTGKEIYEGDILEDLHGERSKVEYNGGAFIIKNRYDCWLMNGLATLDGDLYVEDYRIIGNIYENKDLLE